MDIEGAFIRVPCECLSQTFRKTQKLVVREFTNTTKAISQLSGAEGGTVPEGDAAKALARLEELTEGLRALREAVVSASQEEVRYIGRTGARLDYLKKAPAPPKPAGGGGDSDRSTLSLSDTVWEEQRLDRGIAEYMLRQGHAGAAGLLAEEMGLQDCLDSEIFERAAEVEAGLRLRDCEPALTWCLDNGPRLRRLESSFEFWVRRRVFLELVRANSRSDAVAYAREHLSPHAATHAQEVQQAMATLAFDNPETCAVPEYAALFAPARWEELLEQFTLEVHRVFGLTRPSTLELVLQAGLSTLKTAPCYAGEELRLPQCPVCSSAGRVLARQLPYSHRGHSSLICRITGDLMDENNAPMALPNGHVYSSRALQSMAVKLRGRVKCPATGEEYGLEQLRSVYII